jgi:hypothetical protein
MPRALGLLSTSERRIPAHFVRVQPHHEELVGIGIEPSPQHTYPRHQQDPSDVVVAEDDVPGDAELGGRESPFRGPRQAVPPPAPASTGPIALYGGRVEPGNGCQEMLEYFDGYASSDGDVSLVLMGAKMMRVPTSRICARRGCWPIATA